MNEENVYHPTLTIRTIFNLSVILCFLIVGFSIFYYFVIFLPSREQAKLDLQRQEQRVEVVQKQKNKSSLDACLESVNQNFLKVLDESKSRVNDATAKVLLDEMHKQRDECFKKYPQ